MSLGPDGASCPVRVVLVLVYRLLAGQVGHLTGSSYRTRVGRRPRRRRRGRCTSNSDGPGPGWRKKPLEPGPDRCLLRSYLVAVVGWDFPMSIFSWAVALRSFERVSGLFSCGNPNRHGLRVLMQFGPLCSAFDRLQFRFRFLRNLRWCRVNSARNNFITSAEN